MLDVSPRAKAALHDHHIVVAWADLFVKGVRKIEGMTLGPDGSVAVDSTAASRRSGTVFLRDPASDLSPLTAKGNVSPAMGAEVRLWQGIVFDPDDPADREVWPVGTLPIYEARAVNWSQKAGPIVELVTFDRARPIADTGLSGPFPIAAGANYGEVIRKALSSARPSLRFRFEPVAHVAPDELGLGPDDDLWEECTKMATSCGCELYFDPMGVCVLERTPDFAKKPVDWRYDSGGGLLTELERTLTREGAISHVVVTSNLLGTGEVMGEAFDTDENSPTYHLTFGDVRVEERLDYAGSEGACTEAARGILHRRRGLLDNLEAELVPNPAHEARDIIGTEEAEQTGASGAYVLESFELGLGAKGMMSASPRARRVTL